MAGLEFEIARFAGAQRGYIKRPQLLAAGMTVGSLEYRLSIGRLIRAHENVYAVGHLPTSMVDRAYGAVLACGPGAALTRADRRVHLGIRVTNPARTILDKNVLHGGEVRPHLRDRRAPAAVVAPYGRQRHHELLESGVTFAVIWRGKLPRGRFPRKLPASANSRSRPFARRRATYAANPGRGP